MAPWHSLPAELIQRVAAHLPPNEVACSLRPVCKGVAAALRGPEHTKVRLSRPVPPEAFAEQWSRPGATHPLILTQRESLLRLTATSGVVPNMEVAVRVTGLRLGQTELRAAAEAGQLPMCQWLRQQGLLWDDEVLEAAAGGGQLQLCQALAEDGCGACQGALWNACMGGNAQLVEWLLRQGCPWDDLAPGAAARCGHVAIVHKLMLLHEDDPRQFPIYLESLLDGTAWGCGLEQLRTVHGWCVAHGARLEQRERRLDEEEPAAEATEGCKYVRTYGALASAVLGEGPDWEAKASWLLDEQRYPAVLPPCMTDLPVECVDEALARPDAPQRLAWMQRRLQVAAPFRARLVWGALCGGNAEALRVLLDGGAVPAAADVRAAAGRGHLAALQLLHSRGHRLGNADALTGMLTAAACSGRVEVLDWLERTFVPGGRLMPGVTTRAGTRSRTRTAPRPRWPPTAVDFAACSATDAPLPALRWLLSRGFPIANAEVAMRGASVELVEFLAAHGCLPLEGDEGLPYVFAGVHGNLPVLAALRRLGVPWSARTFAEAVRRRAPMHVLRWMEREGCPLDEQAAEQAVQDMEMSDDSSSDEQDLYDAQDVYADLVQELARARARCQALERLGFADA